MGKRTEAPRKKPAGSPSYQARRWKRLRLFEGETAVEVMDSDSEKVHVSAVFPVLTLAAMLGMTIPAMLADPTLPETGMNERSVDVLLRGFRVPRIVFLVLAVLFQSPQFSNEQNIFSVEYFAGHGAVNRRVEELLRMPTLGYDILHGAAQDFNGAIGYITALQWYRLIMSFGWQWFGTVCSTWVFMSRSSVGRSKTDWRGNSTLACVREGNRQVARTALLMTLSYAHGQGFILEQPASSMMLDSGPMAWVCERAHRMRMHWDVIETFMSAFKPDGILKPTILATNRMSVRAMARIRPATIQPCSVVRKTVRSDGKKQCTGKKDALKATQQYPEEFGMAVAETIANDKYTKARSAAPVPARSLWLDFDDDSDADDPWLDLDLDGCLAFVLQHDTDLST